MPQKPKLFPLSRRFYKPPDTFILHGGGGLSVRKKVMSIIISETDSNESIIVD